MLAAWLHACRARLGLGVVPGLGLGLWLVAASSKYSLPHQRWRQRSSAGALTMMASAGASTPEIHGTCSGMPPAQIFLSTAHGHVSRGELRIGSGKVVRLG